MIGLLDAEARMHELVGEIAVVGQQQQPLAILIESADGIDAFMDVRHKVHRSRPTGGIVVGAEVAARLVDKPVDQALDFQRLAIDLDLLLLGVNLGAQLADNTAIDGNTATEDQLLAVPPRADAGVGQILVEAFHSGLIVADRTRVQQGFLLPALERSPNTAYHDRVDSRPEAGMSTSASIVLSPELVAKRDRLLEILRGF